MQEIEFKIFIKNKGAQLTVNKVVYSLMVVFSGITYLGDKYFDENLIKTFGQVGLILILILIIYFSIARLFSRESLNGTLNQSLKFSETGIEIDNTNYPLAKIKNVEFRICDYFNSRMDSYKGNLNPGRTNGTSNVCLITLIDGQKIALNFQLMYESEFLRMRELLIKYYFENKIQFLKLIAYLEIDNYKEVQEFKRSLSDSQKNINAHTEIQINADKKPINF